MRRKTLQHKQKGAAIIIALFVVALVAAMALAMIIRLHVDLRRTDLILRADQAQLYAQGSVYWAIDQLSTNWKNQKPNQLVDKLPLKSKQDQMNGYTISSTIYDAQTQFNINNLTSNDYLNNFVRLLYAALPDTGLEKINQLAAAARDWVGQSSTTEFENYYAKLNPPYRAAHRPMVSISELRLVKGFTKDIYNKVLPFVTALPAITPVNINGSSIPVYMGLSDKLTQAAAKTLAQQLQQAPVNKIQDFMNLDIVKNVNNINQSQITVISNYFLVKTDVTLGSQKVVLYTLLAREAKAQQAKVSILWQTKGTL